MKRFLYFSIVITAVFSMQSPLFAETSMGNKGFALVELFTSEGCSNCPPADEILLSLTDMVRVRSLPVYTLSFHVDYWNKLGWTDPFSQPLFTQRQIAYADRFHLQSIFTPQMIINGKENFVGSRADLAQDAISDALQKNSTVKINVHSLKRSENEAVFEYTLENARLNWLLEAALVEGHAVSEVNRGENEGRTLQHAHVVRELKSVKLQELQGQITFSLSKLSNAKDSAVIFFLQDPVSLEVVAAAQVNL